MTYKRRHKGFDYGKQAAAEAPAPPAPPKKPPAPRRRVGFGSKK